MLSPVAVPFLSRAFTTCRTPRRPHYRHEGCNPAERAQGDKGLRSPGARFYERHPRPSEERADPEGVHGINRDPANDEQHRRQREQREVEPPDSGPRDVALHTNIDAPVQVTAETKLPRHQAGQFRSSHFTWRWGESNPRPTVVQQDFSGCSSLACFSAPASHANKDADGLSRLEVPRHPPTR